MKKIIVAILTILTLVSSMMIIGCNNGIKKSDENSYFISIYNEIYSQKENGEIVFEGYNLKSSFQVLKSQMFEINDYEQYESNDKIIIGKYIYSNLPSNRYIINNNKLQIFPTSDTTITVRERERKTIILYINKKPVRSIIDYEYFDEYDEMFTYTYEENFSISASYISQALANYNSNVNVELYTNELYEGEPFKTIKLYYSSYNNEFSGTISFNLIKSTSVYAKVVYAK